MGSLPVDGNHFERVDGWDKPGHDGGSAGRDPFSPPAGRRWPKGDTKSTFADFGQRMRGRVVKRDRG